MRIVVIEPRSPGVHIFSAFKLPRLGVVLLGTILAEAGHEVSVQVEELRPLDFEELSRADLVLVSTITCTAPRAYSLCARLKKEGVPTVLGGPHVTFLPDEGLKYSDYVVCGEGEKSVLPLARAVKNGKGFEEVPGLVYRKNGRTVKNPPAPLVCDLDENPHPDFGLVKGWPGKGLIGKVVPVQTSRGCPFGCSFCSVTGMFGRKIRFRSVDNVIAELKSLKKDGDHIFFYDDNFTGHRERAKELFRRMIAEGIGLSWSAQVRVDVARDIEMMDLMKRSGCTRLYIGFETIDAETLRLVQKKQSRREAEVALEELTARRDIDVHGMFVVGFDGDTPASVRRTVEWALEHDVKTAQFLILTPLPGSVYYEQVKKEGRILIDNWGYYDAHHVVSRPDSMTPLELQLAQVKAHARFYSLGVLARHLFRLDLPSTLVGVYARRVNRNWLKSNTFFMKLAEVLSSEPYGQSLRIRMSPTYEEF